MERLIKTIFIISFLLHLAPSFSQITTATDITPRGSVIWEEGAVFDNAGEANLFTLSNSLLRFGVSPRAEVHLGFDFSILKNKNEISPVFSPLTFGTTLELFRGEGAKPSLAFLASVAFSRSEEKFLPLNLSPAMMLLLEHDPTSWLNLAYNLGGAWDGFQGGTEGFTAVCATFAITEKFSLFAENHNTFSASGLDCALGGGALWQVAEPLELNLTASHVLASGEKNFSLRLGFVWEIN